MESEEIQMAERRLAKAEGKVAEMNLGTKGMTQITVRAQELLEKENAEKNWVLAAMRRNSMLSWRPDVKAKQFARSDSQEWAKELSEGTSRMRESWYEDR